MNATEPTYFLYDYDAGRLFHALPHLQVAAVTPHTTAPLRKEDPGHEGPEGEEVGEDDEDGSDDEGDTQKNEGEKNVESKPSPGPGVPMVPKPASPDANPIDPRVFLEGTL